MANMAQAIRMALHFAEENLGVTDIFGEDTGAPLGGVFTCTQGLRTTWNSPLDERGIIGMKAGGERDISIASELGFGANINMELLRDAKNFKFAGSAMIPS